VKNDSTPTVVDMGHKCGVFKKAADTGDRVVGGRLAAHGEFPWAVCLSLEKMLS